MNTNELLRSLAKEARQLKNGPDEGQEETAKKTPKKKESPYAVTLLQYPDVIVTKTTPRMQKHLVILFSAGSAFIKTEQKGKEPESALLTPELYVQFASEMEDIRLPDNYWAPFLKRGIDFGRCLCDALQDEYACQAIRQGYFRCFGDIKTYSAEYGRMTEIMDTIPKLFRDFHETPKALEVMFYHPYLIKDIEHRFGIDNARDFLQSYEESLARVAGHGGYRCVRNLLCDFEDDSIPYNSNPGANRGRCIYTYIPALPMKYRSFKDYVLYDSVFFGYGDSVLDFLHEWNDDLNLQYLIYGKIKEKYPQAFPLHHSQLSYKARLMRQEIDERKFARQAEKAAMYEGKYGDYVFIAPHIKQDFYDEATAQSNCLAGYVQKFTDGDCLILFMRKKDTPDVSYMTVEIVDGHVVQAKLARNATPPQREIEILEKWVDRCNRLEEDCA